MIILSDSDVVRKFAYCELLLELLQYLKCPPNEVWVLPTLRFQLRNKLAKTPEALRNFEQFLSQVRGIPEARIETLERFDTLDSGEQQLLAVLCDEPRVTHLVTGDKKALLKVAALTFGDQQLRTRLTETSVLCLEALLLGLLEKRGFSVLQARVRNKWVKAAAEDVDNVVLQAFPAGGTAEQAERILKERLGHLRASLPPIPFQ